MKKLKKHREGAVDKKVLLVVLIVLVVVLLGEAAFLMFISGRRGSSESSTAEQTDSLPSPTTEPTIEPTEMPTPEPLPTEEPTPEPTEAPTPEPVTNGYMVAIDAGHQLHGNSDPEPIGPGSSTTKAKVSDGTSGCSTGIPEYQLNLDVAKKLQRVLKKRGYQVYLIRKKNDVEISNIERAQAANESGADICIRLHADGIDDSSARGASALYPTQDNPYISQLSKKCEKLSSYVLDAYCERTGFNNRGLSKRDDLTGTNWSEIPVTLIEMGFMSNPP